MSQEPDWKTNLRSLEKQKLALMVVKDGQVLFQSDKPGLEPLVELLESNMNNLVGATVVARVLGLAAARLLLWQNVMRIDALAVSRPAQDLLRPSGIAVNAEASLPCIPEPGKTVPCRFEKLARKYDHPEEFYHFLRNELLVFAG
jgi:hypothetical protein